MVNDKILFVCLGNICRSPTAEAVFRARAKTAGVSVEIDSAGTGAWHAGDPPDPRAIEAGTGRGYSFEGQTARKVTSEDFATYTHILAMDQTNVDALRSICPDAHKSKIERFLDYASKSNEKNVPDPYYGGKDGFEHVVDLIELASDGLIDVLKQKSER